MSRSLNLRLFFFFALALLAFGHADAQINECIDRVSKLAKLEPWRSMRDELNAYANHPLSKSEGIERRITQIAPPSLRAYYDYIGYHLNWSADPNLSTVRFDSFAKFDRRIQHLRRKAAQALGVPLSRIFEARMIFEDSSRGTEHLIRPGKNIPKSTRPHYRPIMDGPTFYSMLAKRIFPVSTPASMNVLDNGVSRNLVYETATEHDFAHLFGILVARPEINDALAEVGQAVMNLQSAFEQLKIFTRSKSSALAEQDIDTILENAMDVQDSVNGVPFLFERLFFTVEAIDYVKSNLKFDGLPDRLHPEQNGVDLAEQIFSLKPQEINQLLHQLQILLSESIVPIGGGSADLRYLLSQVNQLPNPVVNLSPRPYRDHGLLTHRARFLYYLENPEIAQGPAKAEMAIDLAKLLKHIYLAQGIGPEEWMREVIVKPLNLQAQKIHAELNRLNQSASQSGLASTPEKFDQSVLVLPPVDPDSRIGRFIVTAPWFNRLMIFRKFGITAAPPLPQ